MLNNVLFLRKGIYLFEKRFSRKKGDIGLTDIIMVLGTLVAVAVVLYIVFNIADGGLVVSYD